MQNNIKIFVSNRIDMDTSSFKSDILIPVRCGAVFDEKENAEMLGDNTGDNISEKRMTYCEQTVQYWAWKNVEADYYGLFHYRRFFNFSRIHYPTDEYGTIIDEYIDEDAARTYGLYDERMRKVIEDYDLIIPKSIDVSSFPHPCKSMWDHWCLAPDLHEEDLKVLLNVIARLQPDYYKIAKKYLKGKKGFFCGMHVMKKALFHDYCAWLYPILFELEKEIDITTYSTEGQRTVGHLAERLLGIYICYIKEHHPEIRIKELQVVLFTKPVAQKKALLPAFNKTKKAIPVVFSASAEFAPICAVAINSVIQNSSRENNYDIVVLETNIQKKDQTLIKSLAEGRNNISIRFFNVQSVIKRFNLEANEHISIETYYRFLIQDILPGYDKVIYLDSDIVCNKDVADLYHEEIGNSMLAAARDADMCGQLNLPKSDVLRYLTHTVKMENPYDYFQAGVLLLNTHEMRELYSMNQWLTFAQKRYRYCDQDVLNRYCQGRVQYLDMAWNVLIDCNNYRVPVLIKGAPGSISKAYNDARKDPYIVHFAGFQKPWNQRDVDMEDVFWKYARTTPYYEHFMVRLWNNSVIAAAQNMPPIGVRDAMKIHMKKKAKKMFPQGTWRYRIVKSIQKIICKITRKR